MKFLIAFAALVGCAAASAIIVPLYYGVNAGDASGAIIDATVAAEDHARAHAESNARAAEAAHQYNAEAIRQTAEVARDIHDTSYWSGLVASQNAVAAAQSHAAAIDGIAAARAPHLVPLAPLAYAGYAPGLYRYGVYGNALLAHSRW